MLATVGTKRDGQTGLFGSPIRADPSPATAQPSIGPTSLNRQYGSPGRAFYLANPVTLARILAGYLIASFIPTVKATFSIAKCCTLAAREEFHRHLYENGTGYYPWEACNFNLEVEYSNSIVLPSIQRNMAWAMENCRGTQLSSLEQWLVPLSTYISPYIGVILLCPVGGVPERKTDTSGRLQILYTVCYTVLRPLPEYIRLLGDPASALFGAWHEVCSDAKTLAKLTPEKRPTMAERASWITALAGDIEFSEKISWKPKVLEAINEATHMGVASSQEDHIMPVKGTGPSSEQHTRLLSSGSELEQVDRAIDIVITARKGFISGILIPVLLLLAVTAATFYDAYTMRGDKDTALALAYCTWYSWILILGMVGNCYASALSPAVAKKAFNRVLDFGEDPLSVPLGYRYINGHLWQAWADAPSTHLNCRQVREDLKHNRGFWLRFCIGQFLGFCAVAFSTSCAIAIAWTTPTTGLGCRSFNFILYAGLSYVTACLHVLCCWVELPSRTQQPPSETRNTPLLFVRILYWLFAVATSLALVLGTLFHMIGVFRTCWCEQMTWDASVVIELNNRTPQAVENAQLYWLSTAYVAFGTIWLACLTAMGFRRYIVQKMEAWVSTRERMGMHEEDEIM